MIYGDLPKDLGPIEISPVEMMYWMYCPIHTPKEGMRIPENLHQFYPIMDAILRHEPDLSDKYIYITAKVLWVSGDFIGNRPGWHTDGFGTDDVNYIWYDRARTEFMAGKFDLPEDCSDAMAAMAEWDRGQGFITYPEKHLLRLTPSMIHRSPVKFEAGMRAFVKVSISRDRYNLQGNSINHEFEERWEMLPRNTARNHPTGGIKP